MGLIFTSPAPVQWTRIEITGFRILENFVLARSSEASERGQWTLLIGENGVGKTTLLRAFALALGSFRQVSEIARLINPAGLSKEVTIKLDVAQQALKRFFGGKIWNDAFRFEMELGLPVWVYGSQRGNALGGPDREVDLTQYPPLDGLFDQHWPLVHAETWLKNLKFASLEDPGGLAEKLFRSVCQTLIDVLPGVQEVDVRAEGVTLKRWNEEPISLNEWSEGYLTTAGWVLDLIARWNAWALHNSWTDTSDFRNQMYGVVLVDEIDLHLHPAWQTQIVRDLRRLFPRLSFIATTHNPLTLLGAEPGEIFVLRRNAEGEIEALQRDIPPGSDVDRVLTGDWFGLSSTLDSGTLDLLDRHRTLLRSGSPPQAPERRELEVELRQRLGSYGETAVDRIVQDVAADLLPPTSKNLAPAERSALRDKILSIASKKLE